MADGRASALTVTVRDHPDLPSHTWTLLGDPPGGDHPDPVAACAAIDAARAPFAPVPDQMACLQVYGGPETATVTGTWRGVAVEASYRRTDGCETARWRALEAVLR